MNVMTIEPVTNPADEDRNLILEPILAYNQSKGGEENYKQLALFIRDSENQVQGGLWAKRYYDWLFIDLLFVPEVMRGAKLGTNLLQQAEEWAKAEGCVGVWLDTFGFQAPEFYKKQGYTLFGVLENYPPPHGRFFFRKAL